MRTLVSATVLVASLLYTVVRTREGRQARTHHEKGTSASAPVGEGITRLHGHGAPRNHMTQLASSIGAAGHWIG